MTDAATVSGPPVTRLGRVPLAVAVVLGLALLVVAYRRGGVLDLPPVPSGVTIETAGINDRGVLHDRARALETMTNRADVRGAIFEGDVHLAKAAEGLAAVRHGNGETGLQQMREALSAVPNDLVIGNAYRLAVLSLRRSAIANNASRETLADHLPPYLQGESVATLGRLYGEHPSREAGFQLAMAWIDEILLSPKEEARGSFALSSMKLLNEVLATDPFYLPALCARGVGYLSPPRRITFVPAIQKVLRPTPDAASRDLGLCVAIGRRLGAGSPEMAGAQLLNLGDAYAKEGQPQRARSWWQLAQNASRDAVTQEAVRRRFAWRDDELIDNIERDRQAGMADLDHPLTDLSPTWQ